METHALRYGPLFFFSLLKSIVKSLLSLCFGWFSDSLCSCILLESLQVTTVERIPEYHHELGESIQLDIRVCIVSSIVIPLTFGTYCADFLVGCVQKMVHFINHNASLVYLSMEVDDQEKHLL